MNIDVITAPEHKYFRPKTLKIFIAGGICNCPQWQKRVIDLFQALNSKPQGIELSGDYDNICMINPRREDWYNEPGTAQKQIEWEFDMLERCDVFTMYFAGGESDQPICMYELGRNIERMKQRFPTSWMQRIIITCDSSYKRLMDVIVQTSLATDDKVNVNVIDGSNESIDGHYQAITKKLKYIYNE